MSPDFFGELELWIFFNRLHTNFVLLFMFSLKAPIVKKGIFSLQFA